MSASALSSSSRLEAQIRLRAMALGVPHRGKIDKVAAALEKAIADHKAKMIFAGKRGGSIRTERYLFGSWRLRDRDTFEEPPPDPEPAKR